MLAAVLAGCLRGAACSVSGAPHHELHPDAGGLLGDHGHVVDCGPRGVAATYWDGARLTPPKP